MSEQKFQVDSKSYDVEMTEEKNSMEMEVTEGGPVKNKAAGFNPDNEPTNRVLNNPQMTQIGGTQLNLTGNTVEQAAIGNQGPVTFNKKETVYAKGAQSSIYNIMGGNFTQATIGGKSEHNNKNSTIKAGDGHDACIAYTPDLFLEIILQKGATAEELIMLLEKGYSLGHLACALPDDIRLRANVVNALLI